MSQHRAEPLRRSNLAILLLIIGVTLMIVAAYVGTGPSAPTDLAAAPDTPADPFDEWTDPTDGPSPDPSSPSASTSPSPSASPSPSEPAGTTPPPPAQSSSPPSNVNLALHRPAVATSEIRAANGAFYATDGDASTYWEGANHGLPQNLTIDLQAPHAIARIVIKLPPSTVWPDRTQTLSVLGSTNGTTFSTVKGAASYTFSFTGGRHEVTITVPVATIQYVRLAFTANSAWDAGQASEVEVYT